MVRVIDIERRQARYCFAMPMRRCTKCGEDKDLGLFSAAPRGLHGKKSSCKACDAARHRADNPPRPRVGKPRRAAFSPDAVKKCTKCGEERALANFSISRRPTETRNTVYRSECKPCASARATQYFYENRDQVRASSRNCNLKKLYGMTAAEYDAMLLLQDGVCAICHQPETRTHGRTGRTFSMPVDHCHKTGTVRGLLCQNCNRALGLLGDDVDRLKAAVRYLESKVEVAK